MKSRQGTVSAPPEVKPRASVDCIPPKLVPYVEDIPYPDPEGDDRIPRQYMPEMMKFDVTDETATIKIYNEK